MKYWLLFISTTVCVLSIEQTIKNGDNIFFIDGKGDSSSHLQKELL